jgi:hypothetical protein
MVLRKYFINIWRVAVKIPPPTCYPLTLKQISLRNKFSQKQVALLELETRTNTFPNGTKAIAAGLRLSGRARVREVLVRSDIWGGVGVGQAQKFKALG